MRVLVVGGTGNAGGAIVRALQAQGDEVVIASRAQGVDAVTGAGLAQAMKGAEAVVDASAPRSGRRRDATEFFTAVARNLQREASLEGVRRIVTLSIIGIDGLEGRAYFDAKLAHERAAVQGDVPVVILRCAQFHDFGRILMAHLRRGPLVGVPIQPVQSVSVAAVGDHAARLVREPDPAERVDLAGPEPGLLIDQVRALIAHDALSWRAVPLWLPGRAERRIRQGALLATDSTVCAGDSFSTWLAAGSAPSATG